MATPDTSDPSATLDTAAPEAPAKTPRRRTSTCTSTTPRKKAAAADAPVASAVLADAPAAASIEATPAPKAPTRRRRSVATVPAAEPVLPTVATEPDAAEPPPVAADAPAADPAPARPPRTRKRPAAPAKSAPVPAIASEDPAALPPAPAPAAMPDATVSPAPDSLPETPAEPTTEPTPEPTPALPIRATITLRDGRAPVFTAGRDTSDDTLQRLARWQDEDGVLRLPDADALTRLLGELGGRVEVDEPVWALLARRGDLQQRIDHLSALYPHGLDAVDLPAAAGLRACQREGAFYAACVGHCALADEPALAPEQQLALAWQLVQRHFGAQRLALQAPAEAVAGWAALLGTEPALEATAADVLLIDARAGLPPLAALPTTTWLWLLASPTLLDDPAAADWLDALDRTATGAVATWQAQRDERALAPLLLRRRFADVADQWPAWSVHEEAVSPSEDEAAQLGDLLAAMREGLARWQRSGFLSDSDQLTLLRQRRACEQLARAAAIGALVPAVQRALVDGAQRVLVFTADADLVAPLTEVLQGEYLPAQALPAGDEADAALRLWRDADGPRVLVLADDVDAPRLATHPHRPVVILLDGATDETLRHTRLARVRVPRGEREVPVRVLRVPGWPGLPAVPAHALLRGAALAAWLDALQAALRTDAIAP
ncbi:hypothetical protein [Ideonella alba]|uniref:Uncharacterized protein n=1 Tax=Ideonella alba TaxID=2824118 RepID=A0A941BCE4_9BURK|nr:hypothetical protein [Ideonella alba]MBQ0929056.1 hypothetical protein [Ideonella alba]